MGHWHALLWMQRAQPAAKYLGLLKEVSNTGQECIAWFQNLDSSARLPWICTIAAEARNLHMLQSLRKLEMPWDLSLYHAACQQKNFLMLRWVARQALPPPWELAQARKDPTITAALGRVDLMSQIWPVQVSR